MNRAKATLLGLTMALIGLACSAQDSTIPIRQLDRNARNLTLSARATVPENESAVGNSYGMLSGSSSSASAGFTLSRPVTKAPRTLSTGFFLLNGLHLGMAVFDVEMTQHCIANHHCVEGNPLMPSSHAAMLGLNLGFVGAGAFISYKLKKQDSKLWMLSPVVGASAHALGVATGFKNR